MASNYGMFDEKAYMAELAQKKRLLKRELPITEPYYAQLAQKIENPTIDGVVDTTDIDRVRAVVQSEINKTIPKGAVVAYIMRLLEQSNDLVNFYQFGKPFLSQIKEYRGMDGPFFLQLWAKYKTKMLNSEHFTSMEKQRKDLADEAKLKLDEELKALHEANLDTNEQNLQELVKGLLENQRYDKQQAIRAGLKEAVDKTKAANKLSKYFRERLVSQADTESSGYPTPPTSGNRRGSDSTWTTVNEFTPDGTISLKELNNIKGQGATDAVIILAQEHGINLMNWKNAKGMAVNTSHLNQLKLALRQIAYQENMLVD